MKSFAIIVFLGLFATSYGATFDFFTQAGGWGTSSGDIAAGAAADEDSGVGGGATDGDGTVVAGVKPGSGVAAAFGTAFGTAFDVGAHGADESPGFGLDGLLGGQGGSTSARVV